MNDNRVFPELDVDDFIEIDAKIITVKRIQSKDFFSWSPVCHGAKCDSNHL